VRQEPDVPRWVGWIVVRFIAPATVLIISMGLVAVVAAALVTAWQAFTR
jgi:hypothetical protein